MDQSFREVFKNLVKRQKVTKEHILQYAVMRAMQSKSERKREIASYILRKSFSQITTLETLRNNGWKPFKSLEVAIKNTLKYIKEIKVGFELEPKPVPDNLKLLKCLNFQDFNIFEFQSILLDIQNYLKLDSLPKEKQTVYIFVRNDLPKIQQLIQVSHVCVRLGIDIRDYELDYLERDLNHVVFGVTPDEFDDIGNILNNWDIDQMSYFENEELNAVATFPLGERYKKYFENFKLLQLD